MEKSCPLTIKRYRKKKFPNKRYHYKNYNDALWKWEDVFEEIEKTRLETNKFYKIISKKYSIKKSTLKDKYLKYKNNNIQLNKIENRGKNKFFTENQEREIYNELPENINKHIPTYDDDIKLKALNKWKILYPNNKTFKSSIGWCNDFKKRWYQSSLRPRPIKNASHICTEEEIIQFIDNCTNLVNEVGDLFFF